MILSLEIKNYILIDLLKIDFHKQLNIVTGETGAGKSMVFSALELCLGKRLSSKVAKNPDKKTIVELEIDIKKYGLKHFFDTHDLDYEEQLTIRREILPSGKSRTFINDSPCKLSQLNKLTNQLVDLHKQFDNLEIQDLDFHRLVLDTFAANEKLIKTYTQRFEKYKALNSALEEAERLSLLGKEETDYLSFRFNELSSAELMPGEKIKMETDINLWDKAEDLKLSMTKAIQILDGENSVVSRLREAVQLLNPFSDLKGVSPLFARLNGQLNELEDLNRELENFSDGIEYDEQKLTETRDRLSQIYLLEKKYAVQSVEELIEKMNGIETKLSSYTNNDDKIAALKKDLEAEKQTLEDLANKLSKQRKKAIKPLETAVSKHLKSLGFNNAVFNVSLERLDSFNSFGSDSVEFLFSANADRAVQPLRKVASGGEISRLMLCIKSVVADKLILGSLIFDEIDSGISGDAALRTAKMLSDLSKHHQVICITHSPQVASRSDRHFSVVKEIVKGQTNSDIVVLEGEDRIIELATMLSGNPPTKSAIKNAEELIHS